VTSLSILNANVTFVIQQNNKDPLIALFLDRDQIDSFVDEANEVSLVVLKDGFQIALH